MVAAISAASKGADVTLLEKGNKLGYKVLIAGNGACNLTNARDETREFVKCFPGNGKFLYSALTRLSPSMTMQWFEKHGVPLQVERGGRVFPKSRHSKDIVTALEHEIRRLGVEVLLNTQVTGVRKEEVFFVETEGNVYRFDRLIIATGGKSFPGTGSTGDGFRWAKELGHHLKKPFPALVPLKLPEAFGLVELAGLSLRNVRAVILAEGKKIGEEQGEMLFTHTGVSGPIILTLSRLVSIALLEKQTVSLCIDFKPALSHEQVDQGLLRDWKENPKQQLSNALRTRLPGRIVPFLLRAAKVPPERLAAEVTKEERKRLVAVLKGWTLPVAGTLPIETAIVTAGGVDTKEIDPKSMESKKVPGLYWAGEVIDVDGVTGGYNLQAAWSTGWLAGESAAT